jgi:Zn ribbon nucleic-acid-binding protein
MERYFICPECKTVSSVGEWDKATKEVFDDTDVSIINTLKGMVCVCPSCKKQSEIGFAEVTSLITSN